MTFKERLPEELLARPLVGRQLRGRTLGEELGGDLTLIAFLRHFG